MPSKRLKVKHGPARTNKQQMHVAGSFLNLPSEVLIEVFVCLEPLDLLRLARTTRGLRASLLDRHHARAVWRAAIGNVPGMPPCPDHLSEPAYAQLAFDPVCHGCFKRCDTIAWALRMRCCRACLPTLTVCHVYDVCGVDAGVAAREADPPALEKIVALRDLGTKAVLASLNRTYYRRSDLDTLVDRVRHIEGDAAREQLVEAQEEAWEPMVEHARLCREWELERSRARASQRAEVRRARVNAIETRLKALGWTDPSYYAKPFYKLPAVNKAVPLTRAEWARISGKLIASLPQVRRAHLAVTYRERFQLLDESLADVQKRMKYLRVKPRLSDIFLDPDIRAVFEADELAAADRSPVARKYERILPNVMKRWCAQAVDVLASWTRDALCSEEDVNPANVAFYCSVCQAQMDFDMALSHSHLYRTKHEKKWKRKVETLYEEIGKEVSTARSLDTLRVNKSASKVMDDWVKAFGGTVYVLSHEPS